MEQIYVPQFVALKEATRNKLREIFLIPRTSYAEVVTNHMGVGTVMCDGTTNVDLQNFTVEKMRDYLGSAAVNESIGDLFKRVILKIETPETIESTSLPKESTTAQIPENPIPKETIPVDSTTLGEVIKCSKCAFESKSKFAVRMHVSKKHK